MESSSTTTAETPPVATASKRPRRAAPPLRDLTNLLPGSPTTPAPRSPSARRALPRPSASASCSSAASATPPVSKPSAVVEEQEQQPSSVKSPISTVYTSRKSQRRTTTTRRRNPTGDKAPFPAEAAAASCPPPGKAARAGSHSTRKASAAQGSRPISSSAPCLQAKTKRHMGTKEDSSSVRPKLPDDFVEKQRAYFREIDAFELPEEEASETD